MIDTLLIAGVALSAGWIWSRVFVRKPKPIVRYATPQEDAEALKEVDAILGIDPGPVSAKAVPIIKWCDSKYRQCPKCALKLTFSSIKSCDCEALAYSHFHLTCSGSDHSTPPQTLGCSAKYLMLTADVPASVDPKKLTVVAVPKPKKKKVEDA